MLFDYIKTYLTYSIPKGYRYRKAICDVVEWEENRIRSYTICVVCCCWI